MEVILFFSCLNFSEKCEQLTRFGADSLMRYIASERTIIYTGFEAVTVTFLAGV